MVEPQPYRPMKTNVGPFDAGVRSMFGGVVLLSTAHDFGWWALLGLIPIATAVSAFCPFYWLMGIDTAAWEETGHLMVNRVARSPKNNSLPTAIRDKTERDKALH